ncbi:MAG TPA: PorV/PorQ family protein [Bacteroidota bacterium]|nr:PorV/PorQ family protein [Bacteroidota bacterium]
MAMLLILTSTFLNAQQVTKVGTTAAKFLSIPVGARAVGMGGAFVAVANDASAMYWNPAGIARLTQSEAIFSHSEWLADISFNYGGAAVPLEQLGTVGISFTSLTMPEMERTTEDQPEGTGTFFSAGSFAVGVSYAKALTEWFSIGGNVKYINEHIWNSGARGFAMDVGTMFTTPFPGLKFGAGISNFGEKMKISGDDLIVQKDISSDHGNNPNVNASLSTDNFDLPLLLRIGFCYEPLSTEDQQLLLAVDAAHPNDNSESVNLGGEYSVLRRMLSIRAGYKSLGFRDSEEEFTIGGGVKYEIEANFTVRFDYAFEKFGRLNNVHKFAIGILY